MADMQSYFADPSEPRYAILAVQREGNRRLATELAPLDVTPAQAEVIVVLGEAGPLTLKGLGGLLVCESGSPSRLVDTLVRRGLVDRVDNPMDRRQVLLQLTNDGRKLRPKIQLVDARIDEMLREAFGDELLHAMVRHARAFLEDSNAGSALNRRFGG